MQKRTFKIYRYDPDKDAKPRMETVELELQGNGTLAHGGAHAWHPAVAVDRKSVV